MTICFLGLPPALFGRGRALRGYRPALRYPSGAGPASRPLRSLSRNGDSQTRYFYSSPERGSGEQDEVGTGSRDLQRITGKAGNNRLTAGYTLVVLVYMKTAIYLPDSLFADAEITAKQLGLARSQLYVKAIKEFIAHHNKDKITEQLNALYAKNEEPGVMSDFG